MNIQCVGLIALGIVNKKDHNVYENESGQLIYTPKEKLKESNITDKQIERTVK